MCQSDLTAGVTLLTTRGCGRDLDVGDLQGGHCSVGGLDGYEPACEWAADVHDGGSVNVRSGSSAHLAAVPREESVGLHLSRERLRSDPHLHRLPPRGAGLKPHLDRTLLYSAQPNSPIL